MKHFTVLIALSILCSCTITAQILFQDNFSGNLSQWQIITGTWSIVDGKLKGIGHGGNIDAWIYAGNTSWTNYEISVKAFFQPNSGGYTNAEVVTRSTGHWQNEYRISVFPYNWGSPGDSYNNRVGYVYYQGGGFLEGGSVWYLKPIADTAIIKVQVIGRRLAVYVNDKFAWGDEGAPFLPQGKIGLGTLWENTIMFDDVVIRALGPMASIPRLTIDSIAFGDVYLCCTSERKLTIHNDGTAPLTFDTLYCDNSDIIFESGCGAISPGDSCAVTLRYHPSTAGSMSGNGVIAFHEDCAFVNYKISANVIPNVDLRPDSVMFGDVLLCSSETQAINIHNDGTDTLNIDTIHCDNTDFMFETSITAIPPGDSSSVAIHYYPTACGSIVSNGVISVNNNCKYLYFYISSNVFHRITLHPDSIAFGDVLLGTSNTRNTIICNNGTGTLTIDTMSSNQANITLESEFGTILPGDSCIVTIHYNPASYGAMEGNGLITFLENCEFANFHVSANVVHAPYQHGSWARISLEDRSIRDIACGNNVLFAVAADSGSVYRSMDHGFNWSMIIPSGGGKVAVSSVGQVFVQVRDSLYSSSDKGISWVVRDMLGSLLGLNPSGDLFSGIPAEVSNSSIMFRSTDDGSTWSDLGNVPVGSITFWGQHVVASGAYFFSWTFPCDYQSRTDISYDNGDTWQTIVEWYDGGGGCVSFTPDGTIFLGGDELHRSTDLGVNWVAVSEIIPNNILPVNDETIVISTNDQGNFISTNTGNTWLTFNTGLTNLNVHTLAMDSLGYVYAGTDSGVFKIKMDTVTYPTTVQHLQAGWNLFSLPIYPFNHNKVFNYPEALSSAFEYTGNYEACQELCLCKGYWLKIGNDSHFPLWGYNVHRDSVNVSVGWNMIGSLSEPFPTSTITSEPPGMVTGSFWGYDGTQYVTSDTISSGKGYWVKINQSGKLFLSTSGGAYNMNRIKIIPTSELPPPPPGENEGIIEIPKVYALDQAYPNPFNPNTTIQYQLPENSNVSLKVYNTLGQLVITLTDQLENAGFKSVEWNASNVASGVYFYRLEAVSISDPSKTFTQVKKMLLVK